MPWSQDKWMIGMIVARRFAFNKHLYDIEWYSPLGITATLCSYNHADITVFIRRFEELRRGDPPNEYAFCEPYVNEIVSNLA